MSIKVKSEKKGKKWQATIEIEQGSKNLKLKMPFHKSASSSASEDATEENKPKKREAESKMTTTTMITVMNSSNKKAMPKASTTKKQAPSPAPVETTESAPKEKKAKK